jgi:thymidylate synthase (FAD)
MKIFLISKPSLDNESINNFLKSENAKWSRSSEATDAAELVEFSGRICYMSFGERQVNTANPKYIKDLITKKHESVLEHATWTFIATGVTRAFTHQLVRHRIGFSYSQLSQQYHDHRLANFIQPLNLKNNEELKSEWEKAVQAAKDAYSKIEDLLELQQRSNLDNKIKTNHHETKRSIRSTARSVLPNCIETKIVFSANARSLRHFLQLRGNIVGDLEMRIFCSELLSILKNEAPCIFFDFLASKHSDGYPIVLQKTQTD